MRRTYETDADLGREREIASYLERTWNCNLRKLDKYGAFDFAFEKVNDEGMLVVCGFVEIKRRNCKHDAYPTILVSASKRQHAISMLDATGCSAGFVIVYDDLVRLISFTAPPCYTTVGGRSDRGDSADQEVVLHYKIDRLTDLGQSPFTSNQRHVA